MLMPNTDNASAHIDLQNLKLFWWRKYQVLFHTYNLNFNLHIFFHNFKHSTVSDIRYSYRNIKIHNHMKITAY